jgi:hypothetical protein
MKQLDAVTVAALEYETATLSALRALKEPDDKTAQIAACLRFGAALAAIEAMSIHNRTEAIALLTLRGRIKSGSWRVIRAAVAGFAERTQLSG